MEKYAVLSIETHLFFARIMKEHALFLEAGFPCKDEAWIKKADWFKEQFEELLRDAVEIGEGRIGGCILKSGELLTEFTIPAEKRTASLSGIAIDSEISGMERRMIQSVFCEGERNAGQNDGCGCEGNAGNEGNRKNACGCESNAGNRKNACGCRSNVRQGSRRGWEKIHEINRRALRLLNGLIEFKENILNEVADGNLFNANYPLLIQHIIREAKLYRATVEELLRNGKISRQRMGEMESFWNQIMMEHALFIRGLLDPSEEELIAAADGFAADYKKLLEQARQQDWQAMDELTRESLEETLKYREFKTAGAEGILCGEIASIILPLLADHVLREANHYIRILECGQ